MRGRPLIEWLGFVAVWALLLIPLLHVTGGGAGRPVAAVASDVAGAAMRVPVWLRVTFSELPDSLVVYSDGDEVWREAAVSAENEQLVDIVLGPGGPDLEIEAQWPREGRRAVAVVVEPVEGRSWRALLWSETTRLRESLVFVE